MKIPFESFCYNLIKYNKVQKNLYGTKSKIIINSNTGHQNVIGLKYCILLTDKAIPQDEGEMIYIIDTETLSK